MIQTIEENEININNVFFVKYENNKNKNHLAYRDENEEISFLCGRKLSFPENYLANLKVFNDEIFPENFCIPCLIRFLELRNQLVSLQKKVSVFSDLMKQSEKEYRLLKIRAGKGEIKTDEI